ncbi:flagellar motor switch phosphatase FliY [Salisediminibacterium selenitireducens]|uniref:CheC, inhibitor of MCP methylation / FliN fusion protein n=1 Tax=Bacillus selenitireducens (strain ATCC 700615 / DSM 15326 / MLS10) TaxID=439292 RepID=D6XTX6_BACIE|nr:flagellar motor switch phosphatase FliY [Salisediminibacterium selenitireducens]ADH99262.1 CheC, inhibitor of MCP methylation / FliN fusion protein [[Bacillus] selenitireducens MLS10]
MMNDNDDMLSQDEINALLSGMDDDDDDSSTETETDDGSGDSAKVDPGNYLSDIEIDALGEIGNISFGSSATALSTLLNQKVDITTPKVSVVRKSDLEKEFPKPHVAISVTYTAGFEGLNLLVIKTKDASIIADLMMGNDGTNAPEEMGDMELSAVQEAMNQMMGSASTSMSTIFNKKVDISPPGIDMMDLAENPDAIEIPGEDVLVQISFNLKIGDLIDSRIMQLLTVSFAKDMVDQLMNPGGDDDVMDAVQEDPLAPAPPQPEQQAPERQQQQAQREQQAPPQQQQAAPQQPQQISQRQQPPGREANVQPAAFSSFETPSLNENEQRNLDLLMDIPLEVTVELGRTKRSIKEILELGQGSIVELDKLAGEPVDILVNQRLIAKGEVVVIDENFGVRVTDIVSQAERLKQLK